MKRIITNGITDLEPLAWQQRMVLGHRLCQRTIYTRRRSCSAAAIPSDKNRLVLVRCPEGTVYEPVRTKPGQYLGRPAYHDGQVVLLLVDFPKGRDPYP